MKLRGRPYPKDMERKLLVTRELLKKNMSITKLSMETGIDKSYLSKIINGTYLSKLNEEKIAAFFGLPSEALFPRRTYKELEAMRKRRKGKAA